MKPSKFRHGDARKIRYPPSLISASTLTAPSLCDVLEIFKKAPYRNVNQKLQLVMSPSETHEILMGCHSIL